MLPFLITCTIRNSRDLVHKCSGYWVTVISYLFYTHWVVRLVFVYCLYNSIILVLWLVCWLGLWIFNILGVNSEILHSYWDCMCEQQFLHLVTCVFVWAMCSCCMRSWACNIHWSIYKCYIHVHYKLLYTTSRSLVYNSPVSSFWYDCHIMCGYNGVCVGCCLC